MDYQDMLAYMGHGSAHPGGYSATIELIQSNRLPPEGKILEVGCGTGRTACELAKKGYDVTAIDIRPIMIQKAKQRALQENLNIKWVLGDIHQLPFEDQSFDIIFAESVTVFVNAEIALKEYYRLLSPNGFLFDREMINNGLSPTLKKNICQFYGVKTIPTTTIWVEMVQKVGFKDVCIENLITVAEDMVNRSYEEIDPYQYVDSDVYTDPSFFDMSMANSQLMFKTAKFLAHGVIIARKT